MKYIIYILLFLPFISQAQNVVGQVTMTEAQRVYLRDNRFDVTTGQFISDNVGGYYHGDGIDIQDGAETFLNEEESTGYACQWDWNYTGAGEVTGQGQNYEPTPDNETAGQPASTLCTEYIHFAAYLSYIWQDDATSVTFSGETKARSAHALDLARAVFDVLNDQRSQTGLDFTVIGNYPAAPDADISNPIFVYATKMAKYMESYAMVSELISGDAFYISNYAAVESWFEGCYDWYFLKAKKINDAVFGAELPANINTGTTNTAYNTTTSFQTWWNVSGVKAGNKTNQAQQSGLQNRNWDIIGLITTYGLIFNNTTAKDFGYEMFEFTLKMLYYADGSNTEWYRASSSNPSGGLAYVNINTFHIAKAAFQHAVAVDNGLTGVSDRGKYFDYSTSDGSDELYTTYGTGGNLATSTSGGPKSLLTVIKSYSKYFRTAANGGYRDVRYSPDPGTSLIADDSNPTFYSLKTYGVGAALANTYYNDSDLEDFYMFKTQAGYPEMRWYVDGGTPNTTNAGPYYVHSMGSVWGSAGALGGYAGLAQMEGEVFTPTVPVTAIVWSDDVQSVSDIGNLDLTVNFTPTNATNKVVTYSSTNTGVVNNSGVVTGVGTCTLTVTADDTTNGTLTDDMNVTIYASETPGLRIYNGGFYNINGGTYQVKIGQ